VTARESLTTTLANLLSRTRNGRMDAHRAEAERLVSEVLDEYAHALAEEAREFVGPRAYPGEAEPITRYVAGWHDAIDRIDPEVKA
jgi:hypothetical protein